jgi:hypothetical protein
MDVLYHYCSTASFHKVVETRQIRLSALSLSNDTLEGKVVAAAIGQLAERDKIDRQTCERLQEMIGFFGQLVEGLGFCLSEDGDVLSQWRGYAADASGVAIGFSRAYLEQFVAAEATATSPGCVLRQVKYDPSEHQAEVEPTYSEAKMFIDAGAFSPGVRSLLDSRTDEEFEAERKELERVRMNLNVALFGLFPKLYLLKSRAFREEREWRLISHWVLAGEGERDLEYRAVGDRLIAYRTHPLRVDVAMLPIADVVLGPKHLTPVHMIEAFLKQHGFGKVTVRRSAASYR